jgi:hypothetical protein
VLTLSNQHIVGLLIIVRQLKERRRILNHFYHRLRQGTIPIFTLLEIVLHVALFQLLRGQANIINIIIVVFRIETNVIRIMFLRFFSRFGQGININTCIIGITLRLFINSQPNFNAVAINPIVV